MTTLKHCPNCGNEIEDVDVEFCTACGYNLSGNVSNIAHNPIGFFDNLSQKTSFPILIFSFIIFGIFLFAGTILWSAFMSNGSIDLITYFILTIVFSVFFGAVFLGYFGCKNQLFVVPNFMMYLGSIFAVILCGIGLIFTFLMGIISALSSAFSSGSSVDSYQSTASSFTPSVDYSFIFKIILFILLIPVASYLGVYLGYILKENI